MVSYLDCIKRTQIIIPDVLSKFKERSKELREKWNPNINEIIMVGSGTSNTTAVTSQLFMEQVSGLSVSTLLPNHFMKKSAYNKNAIYIFTSQSGTSIFTVECLNKAKEIGGLTLAITGNEDNKLKSASDIHVNMGCGYEEYGQRTIGYCTSVLTQMLVGLEIGLLRGHISEEKYNAYIEDASKLPFSQKEVVENALTWFDCNKDALINAKGYIFYGTGPLWGVALEGALKALEVVGKYLCVGYEMDDGLHGPTMGFTKEDNIIILDDGKNDVHYVKGLKDFIVNELGNAFIIGKTTKDNLDLAVTLKTKYFYALELAPAIQVLAYRLAKDQGIDIPVLEGRVLPEYKYFSTHEGNVV